LVGDRSVYVSQTAGSVPPRVEQVRPRRHGAGMAERPICSR
jgi:hypothetical protein